MIKRAFDFGVSTAAILILWPVLLLIAALIYLGSPGPIFYRGVRTGLHGKPFRIFKFRTMVVNAERIGGNSTALNDPRLTHVGKFLRKYKLDELPQVINILLGDMSFVGPRPQVEKYTRLYSGEDKIILSVKPGVTDYASIRFINLDEILGNQEVDDKYLREIEPEKNRLRVKYVRDCSFLTDCRIILLTILHLFRTRFFCNTKNLEKRI